MTELDKAIKLLRNLLRSVGEYRNEKISVESEIINGDQYIVVYVNENKYATNVECEGFRSMIKSVVNKVILKI
jgi:hypothetical protein